MSILLLCVVFSFACVLMLFKILCFARSVSVLFLVLEIQICKKGMITNHLVDT